MQQELKTDDLYSHDFYIKSLAISNFVDYLRFLAEKGKIENSKVEGVVELLMSKDKEAIDLGIEIMVSIWEEFKN